MAKYTEDTKIREVLKDERAREIVARYFGEEILKHPLVPMVKLFSLKRAIAYKSQVGIPVEEVDKMIEEIYALD